MQAGTSRCGQALARCISDDNACLIDSAMVDTLTFMNGAATRMTTSNQFDNLKRLTGKDSRTGILPVSTFNYAYNLANQRTAIPNADSSRWSYAYDPLGQVTSGKRHWSDGSVVAGQQFEYSFDDIGNRKTAASGGDEWGANLRYQNYSANNLNQYTARTVPAYVDVQGSAHSNATVTVNTQSTYRKGEYFRKELGADNAGGPLWFGITNVAVLTNGTGPDIVTTNEGNLLVAKGTEAFLHDLDGNQTSDSLWTNIWNCENRLISTESASGVPSGGKAKETWSHLPDGRWIERVVSSWNGSAYVAQSTNRFVWDPQVLLAILDHTNGLVTSLARGLDLSGSLQGASGVGGVLAVNIATNGTHFAAFDGNGNVSALVSATNGAVTANYEYSPFGETLRADGVVAKANPIRFSTQLADDVTGNLKYLFRDYQPTIGRWPNRDPIEERGGRNLYGFVRNNPISRIDRLGLSDNNSPSGNLELPFSALPCSEASATVNSGYAEVATRLSIKIIVVAPGPGGEAEDGEIGPFPIGTRWLPMSGDEAPNVACRMKYKCTMKCCCAFGTFNPVWKGAEEWVYGRIFSRPKINKWTGQQETDQDGNWVWTNAKCVIDNAELAKAKADCKNTSKGKCDTKIQLRSH